MNILSLELSTDINSNSNLKERVEHFEILLSELRKKALPDALIQSINKAIEEIHIASSQEVQLKNVLRKKQSSIIKMLEKEMKLVPKFYYRNLWMVLGMSAFGIPLGVAFSMSIKNLGFIGIGLPIGMAIGMIVGTNMDKKAFDEGRQLDVVLKY